MHIREDYISRPCPPVQRVRHDTLRILSESRRVNEPALMVDGRMLFSSGIGRYLREILQRKSENCGVLGVLCNSQEQLEWIEAYLPTAQSVAVPAKVYSFREQLLAWRFPRNFTYWVPHYNVPRLFKCRLVATVHDLAPLALPELFGGRIRRWAARYYFQGLRRRADRIITVSQFTRTELQRRGVAHSNRITVVPNGVGAFWFGGAPSERRSHRLLYVGNLKPHKNLGRLVEAVALVRQHEPKELDIVGRIDGFRTGLSAALLDRLRSTPWIHLHGELSDEALRRRYQEADCLLFPSLYEGFGLPILEAMAAGCLILSSNAGALVEVSGNSLQAGGVVDFFDPRDVQDIASAILRHGSLSGGERLRLQRAGRSYAANYSWDKTAAATWAVLTEISTS